MQRITHFFAAAALAALVTACDGARNPVGPTVSIGGGTTGTAVSRVLSATVNGETWTATTVTGGFDGATLTISGTDGTASLQISVPDLTGPGSIDLGPANANGAGAFWIDRTGTYAAAAAGGSGVLTVTTATTSRVTGTFSFIGTTGVAGGGTATVTVTSGQFDITTP